MGALTRTEPAVAIPSLSARSVALSVLLGVPDGALPVRALIATGQMCDVAPATMRVALSRLVASGELTVHRGTYALAQHHRERQRLQQADLDPPRQPWNGAWELVAVVESGRDATERARLRALLRADRLAELREGLWMRPANLARAPLTDSHITTMRAHPHDPSILLAKLWDLRVWADTGHRLLTAAAGPELDGPRFAAMTALVRHLRTDPALPEELLPADWPASALRTAYDDYRSQLHEHHARLSGEPT